MSKLRIDVTYHAELEPKAIDQFLEQHDELTVVFSDDKARTRTVEIPKGTQQKWLSILRSAAGLVVKAELQVVRSSSVGV
ncbi:MAG TPA: hypothetical protein VJJ72_01850 [Candidatus Paceibacterota bacterium]